MSPAAKPLAPELRTVAPRELAMLTASLLIVIAPHAPRAPWWLMLLTLCLYGWRGYFALNRRPLPARWLLLAVAAVAMLGVWIEYRTLFGRSAGIVLLVLFSGLKLLETQTHRDAAIAAFLGYFLIITNFLYTQSIPTALAMCAALFALTLTLTGISAPQRPVRDNARTAGLVLGQALPAALLLFLLFPRVQGPLWGLPQDAYSGLTGLSESMSPGNISRLAQSDAIAFRAEFDGESPPQRLRYWRGPVLWDFDGRTWSLGANRPVEFPAPSGGSMIYRYDVVLEPHNRTWLFSLETAASLPEGASMMADGQIIAAAPIRSRIRYAMASMPDGAQPPEDRSALRRALRLPPDFNPRALALAREWRESSGSDSEIVARAIAFLREGDFGYTLEPLPLGHHSVDEFLFETRAGFCEYFSSAFAFLMRAAGVPARVVTGYQGGERNPVDQILTVRQSDAHAWNEVYLEGRGWVRVDPTAVAVPGRVNSGLVQALPRGELLPILLRTDMEWARALRHRWEALAHQWNVWVLGYNVQRQRDLMRMVGMGDADWRTLTAALFTLLGLLTLALLVWSLRGFPRADPVQKAWGRFCRKLAARGVERAPHEGPRDFAQRAARALPAARRAILGIGALYIALRYGSRLSAAGVEELRRKVRELRVS
jgi:protein-glutamine gamma-glutamyltransferase